MKHPGLTAKQVEESRQEYGANTLTQIPPEPLWKKILEGFKDPMIMILLVALVVQVVLFFLGQSEWFEPVGILVAILIANGVASISENKQEGKASALKEEEEAKEMAKVLRDGKLQEIHVSEVVVGDIVYEGKSVTYIKGAPEKIIEKCSHYIDENGDSKELVEKNYLTAYIDAQAGRSMRLLAVAKADGDSNDSDLTLICVISIRDNVRKEAADAIKEVQNAGIQVVMVTGDRKETAVAIAKEAGLLSSSEDIALTSAEMAEKSDEELRTILPHLRVVSRALPTDKSRLVRIAQDLNLVVGMTGDGVNDSPALKKADVGFAMGSGTEVAKEAGDITILDDNFSSIEKAILYT